jgi:hypothetical protein
MCCNLGQNKSSCILPMISLKQTDFYLILGLPGRRIGKFRYGQVGWWLGTSIRLPGISSAYLLPANEDRLHLPDISDVN